MSSAIQLGPLLLPFAQLLVFALAGATLALGKWLLSNHPRHPGRGLEPDLRQWKP